MESAVLKVREDGRQIKLMDGSTWTINVEDISKTIAWYPTQRIVVEENNDAIYPYTLTNLDTSTLDKVKASSLY